jgi:hypothetical protein
MPDLSKMPKTGIFQHISAHLNYVEILDILDYLKMHQKVYVQKTSLFKKIHRALGAPPDVLFQWLENLNNEFQASGLFPDSVLQARDILKSEFPYELIYLPTYRRIEEDLKNLSDTEISGSVEESVIQFGMHDVLARIDQ